MLSYLSTIVPTVLLLLQPVLGHTDDCSLPPTTLTVTATNPPATVTITGTNSGNPTETVTVTNVGGNPIQTVTVTVTTGNPDQTITVTNTASPITVTVTTTDTPPQVSGTSSLATWDPIRQTRGHHTHGHHSASESWDANPTWTSPEPTISTISGNGNPVMTSRPADTTYDHGHGSKTKTWSESHTTQLPIYTISSALPVNRTACPGISGPATTVTITNTVVETVTGFAPPSSSAAWEKHHHASAKHDSWGW